MEESVVPSATRRERLLIILFLAQVAVALPTAVPRPEPTPVAAAAARTPSLSATPFPTSLSDYARDRRLKKAGAGTVSTAGGTGTSPSTAIPSALDDEGREAARAAQERMDRAVAEGRSMDENVGASTASRAVARHEWDTAAESCRKTHGCIPSYRSNGATKALKTDQELLEDLARKSSMSGAPRPDR